MLHIPHHFDLGTIVEPKLPASGEAGLSNETMLDLIGKIADGKRSALVALYDSTSRLIFGSIVRILGDRTSAEEALLDAYTGVWKQSASYDPGILPMEWLMTIARSSAVARLHWIRRDNRKQEISADTVDSAMSVDSGRQTLARSSLEALPSAQRELLEWAYYGGMSCGEMAAQIGKPIGAVKTLLRLGLSGFGENFTTASGR
jgi:RNA polymerase sigma-70 factor (ECF subfamily)